MLPPGPPGKILTTLRLAREPLRWYQRWARRYGDPFRVAALNGEVVLTARPANVQRILSARPEIYEPFAAAASRSVIGDGVIFAMTGGAHRRERKLLTPPFHGARMRAYGEAMLAIAEDYAQRRIGDAPFRAIDITTEISRDVILQTVFGAGEGAELEALRQAIDGYCRRLHPLLFFSQRLHHDLFGFGPWARLQRAVATVDALIYAKIRAHKARAARGEPLGEDILSLLVTARYEDGAEIDESHLRDTLLTLLFAGHETTAVALAWALYHVYSSPPILGRLRQALAELGEHPSPEAIAEEPYLKAVCQESLRLHPIVTDVIRLLREELELEDGVRVPAGMGVGIATVLLHADPTIYPEPERFNPERFVDQRPGLWTWLPFGGGHRRCIGAAFSLYEMALVLATIVRGYDLEVLEPKPLRPARRNVTMGPSTGVRMRLRRRLDVMTSRGSP